MHTIARIHISYIDSVLVCFPLPCACGGVLGRCLCDGCDAVGKCIISWFFWHLRNYCEFNILCCLLRFCYNACCIFHIACLSYCVLCIAFLAYCTLYRALWLHCLLRIASCIVVMLCIIYCMLRCHILFCVLGSVSTPHLDLNLYWWCSLQELYSGTLIWKVRVLYCRSHQRACGTVQGTVQLLYNVLSLPPSLPPPPSPTLLPTKYDS